MKSLFSKGVTYLCMKKKKDRIQHDNCFCAVNVSGVETPVPLNIADLFVLHIAVKMN